MTLVEKVARELCRWDGLVEPIPHSIAILMAKRIIKMVREEKHDGK